MQRIQYHVGIFYFILLISLGIKAEPPTGGEKQVLGRPVNMAHMANYTHYVNPEPLVDRTDLRNIKDSDGKASNFRVQGQHYGHHITKSSLRTKDWNNTIFHNFSMENMNSHSIDAQGAQWSHFYVSGTISDWDFRGARLVNGWFNARMKNVDFRKAHLINIGFYGSELRKTRNPLKFGKGVNFDGAILENVTFKGSLLKHVSFRKTIFRSNVNFENANVHFVTQFAGATFEDNSGKQFVITQDQANILDERFNTAEGTKNITSEQIIQNIQK